MEIRGKVHEVGATQQVTESFKKRDLIVAYAENPQFVEYIRFEATQDRVNIFDSLAVGDEVEVSFNLRGRPWTNKEGMTTYFNSLVAWRVTKVATTSAAAPAPGYSDMPPVDISTNNAEDDDLPF
ncbi:MAG: DUF3127 domain-containing protein [Sphingobacterium sp.]